MFGNLPGRVTSIREPNDCEFEQSGQYEAMKELIDSGKASEALKLQYAKGEEWRCEQAATLRVQGETDSFGAEYLHYCEECYKLEEELQAYYREKHANDEGHCEWCKKATPQKHLCMTRDIDEGSSGPVYEVCADCRKKQNDYIDDELEFLAEQGY